jgi:hypothetical protein
MQLWQQDYKGLTNRFGGRLVSLESSRSEPGRPREWFKTEISWSFSAHS